MIYTKKKNLFLNFKVKSDYDILKENFELPIFVDKKQGNYCQANTRNEFFKCLMSTKPDYFKTPSFIKEICDIFSYLKSYSKSDKKLFDKTCKTIIKTKLKQIEQEL